ncbi:MAG: RluA family pseudouridine synthase [Deltaproteobacteria bacterium]|nr:MAG: RluA family pseudouridine synthase [Deltaproteobacteria bacterium]
MALPDDTTDDASDDDDEPVASRLVTHQLTVDPAGAGERIDALIAATLSELSRAQVQRLIDGAQIRLNGAVVAKPGQRVRAGDAITVDVPPAEPVAVAAEDPLGHPRGTLVNALLFHCTDLSGIGGALRPGIVHRLDKDTSGAIVAAKSDRAHAALAAAFAAKSRGEPGGILREYLGITAPAPPATTGTLRTLHGRHPTDRKRFSSKVATGKPAVTHWTVVEPLAGAALVRFRLETGRTHQIRVHAADHGFALLGDPLYGRTPRPLAPAAAALGRQALHAAVLELDHPITGARLRLEAPLPDDLTRALSQLRATRSST